MTRTNGRTVRIAAGQGFWGDWLEAPVRQVRGGPIDYLMMDYLAEVTMSIMQKQKSRDPAAGYARDFVPLMERILPDMVERGIRVTSNAGGVNPRGCAEAVLAVGAAGSGCRGKLQRRAGVGRRHPRPAGRADRARPCAERHGDRAARSPTFGTRCCRANAYLGMAPIVEALRGGADVVVTGRVTDTGLTLGPMFHEFGWSPDDWDKVAAGTVAGHIIECGAQASGGNLLKGWRSVKGLADPGFPIVEASSDGSFVVTKHPGTGGVVSVASRHGAAGLRDGRSAQLHHPRRRGRLHHHPAAAGRTRPGAGERHPRRPAHADAQGLDRLLLGLQGGRHAGLCLARGVRQGQGGRPGIAASAWPTSAWRTIRFSPNSSASTPPTAG